MVIILRNSKQILDRAQSFNGLLVPIGSDAEAPMAKLVAPLPEPGLAVGEGVEKLEVHPPLLRRIFYSHLSV